MVLVMSLAGHDGVSLLKTSNIVRSNLNEKIKVYAHWHCISNVYILLCLLTANLKNCWPMDMSVCLCDGPSKAKFELGTIVGSHAKLAERYGTTAADNYHSMKQFSLVNLQQNCSLTYNQTTFQFNLWQKATKLQFYLLQNYRLTYDKILHLTLTKISSLTTDLWQKRTFTYDKTTVWPIV